MCGPPLMPEEQSQRLPQLLRPISELRDKLPLEQTASAVKCLRERTECLMQTKHLGELEKFLNEALWKPVFKKGTDQQMF